MLKIHQLTSDLLPQVNVELHEGQCICIYGESGSGKTLLLRAIADLDTNSGEVFYNNKERGQYSADQWRHLVTYLPAESHWWSDDVRDHFVSDKPDYQALGLPNEIANWQVARLSSGEKQRLALLRAVDHNPKVLLLDEITANLDSDNTKRVEQFIAEKLKQGLAVIWVSHDKLQRERVANESYLIQNGSFSREETSHGPD